MTNNKYQIVTNYVKDLSFEIPSPDCFVDAVQNLGKYETKVDISNKPLKNGMIELNCKLIFEAPKEVQNKIHAEACLAIVFKISLGRCDYGRMSLNMIPKVVS